MANDSSENTNIAERVQIGIQYSGTMADIGPLVSEYGDEPRQLARANGEFGDGDVEITVQRTHEWEHVITLVVLGAGTFGAAVLKTLGERTVDWIAEQIDQEDPSTVQLKFEGEDEIELSEGFRQPIQVVVDKFEEASEKDKKIIIKFE